MVTQANGALWKISAPLWVFAHCSTQSLTFCWHLQWHSDFYLYLCQLKLCKDHSITSRSVDDEDSCALISAADKELFLVLCLYCGGVWWEVLAGSGQQAVAPHMFAVRCPNLHVFPFCRDPSLTSPSASSLQGTMNETCLSWDESET